MHAFDQECVTSQGATERPIFISVIRIKPGIIKVARFVRVWQVRLHVFVMFESSKRRTVFLSSYGCCVDS